MRLGSSFAKTCVEVNVVAVPMAVVDDVSVPGGGVDPGGGGVGGVIAVVLGLVGDVVVGDVGDVVVGLVGEVVVVLVGDVAVGLIGDEFGFGFGLEFGSYRFAVGACGVMPVVAGADVVCAMAAVDSVAATANAKTFSG